MSSAPPQKTISVVTPCYNEEAGIRECYERVKAVFDERLPNYKREHLFIDNCSTDKTVEILKSIAKSDPNVKIIVNARNFGLSKSPYHGKLQATGDAVVPIVADLQTPPEIIVDLVHNWERGYKMVIAVREGMEESFFTKLWRSLFYKLMKKLSKVEQLRHFIGFGLFDRQVMDILRSLDEPDPYFRGLVSEIGFEKAFVPYHQPPRKHGKSRHNFFDLLELSMLALTTYSKVPIRLMTIAGAIGSVLSLVMGLVYLCLKILYWNQFAMGQAPLVIGLFFFSAINLAALGLVGEYVGLVLQYARRFPLVVEKERINF
ncbi:glycosyltransferase family 2 protein [Terrarubrum flagellatum]|uniref:glycosyltransferase family 2 protein n=1 Tax=Terrirubrum flagellatum TaxID=2895980 RepID=UPI0031451879